MGDTVRKAGRHTIKLPCGDTVVVYATHLHHKNVEHCRFVEAQTLLADLDPEKVATLVVADWNQPRRRDYSTEEWAAIARSARIRGEPEDDGVGALFETHGFNCSLDVSESCLRNWPGNALPPPTHWSGTAIDYSFARGLVLHGTYVIPSDLSDHFPVVSDWILEEFSVTG